MSVSLVEQVFQERDRLLNAQGGCAHVLVHEVEDFDVGDFVVHLLARGALCVDQPRVFDEVQDGEATCDASMETCGVRQHLQPKTWALNVDEVADLCFAQLVGIFRRAASSKKHA